MSNKLFLIKLLTRLQELTQENQKLKKMLDSKSGAGDANSPDNCPRHKKPVMNLYQKTKLDAQGNLLCDNCEETIGCRIHVIKIRFCSTECLEEFFTL